MPRSIEEIKADIAKVQAEIAQRKTYSQPQTRVGWATYMIDNDRGMLDKYADAERAYNNMLMQQEHAKAMQQEQLKQAKELAALQRQEQSAINLNTARDTLAKLQLMKENLAAQGHDTREVDLQIAALRRDNPALTTEVITEEYDPTKTVEYVLADVDDIDTNNTQDEINAARERVAKYRTPEAIKVLNKLDKTLAARIKKEEGQEKYNDELQAWQNGAATSAYLYNLGLETQFAGDKERLVNKKTDKVVAERPRTSKPPRKPAKPTNKSWEL